MGRFSVPSWVAPAAAVVNPILGAQAIGGMVGSGKFDFNLPSAGGEDAVNPASTLTPEQQKYLAQLTGLSGEYLPKTMSTLGGLAYNPESNYSKIGNWENEFQAGVVNPAMNQMNSLIDNTKHSSNLHSSANRYAQDQFRQKTNDNLSGLRYDQLMKERSMQLQGLDNAQANQMSAIGALNNLSGQSLGLNGVENIVSHQPGMFDYANLGINALSAGVKGYSALNGGR